MAEPSAKRDGSESEKLSTNTLEDSKTVLENSEAPVPVRLREIQFSSLITDFFLSLQLSHDFLLCLCERENILFLSNCVR